MSNQLFQNLKELPTPLYLSQCVSHKHELLICGDNINNKNKDRNQITLLSFGGSKHTKRHTLVMKYVSVWSNISNKSNECNNYNQWSACVIGGGDSHLLFITYFQKNISVFNLNTFQFIKHDILPTGHSIEYHCFISQSKSGQGQEMMKTNKQNYQLLLFKCNIGLSIEYDKDNNTFQFYQLPVCNDIAPLFAYAYVCVNDVIFFFGGYGNGIYSKLVHKYSIEENKWTTFQNTLSSQLCHCIAILSEEDNHIHIIGGLDDKNTTVSTHMKTKVRAWDLSLLVIIYLFISFGEAQINFISKNELKFFIQYWIRTSEIKFGWIDDFDKIILKYGRMK
ncbi:hypothetical protein RFI_22443 [Reticulomyxa filosa]|uniref:Kelch motif family protein n=1 Tax=Reticulomyxa filosa TaxID=46433 RepID=X6MM72_RETFI|nr:hypothetical protein RFI_22443 [Reticulomyxa filosa]|eukprot:ETO14924.1 hypothetical protein RFI_22443 [Reticulomyxa filosa]